MLPISDNTMRAVEYALDGLKLRADTRANNVANVNTPNFEAKDVDFESALRSALLNTGRADGAGAPAVVNGNGLPNAQGNTVDLETEVVGLMKDNLMRDAMVNAYNFKIATLRTAINGVSR
jgi:flagellar basal-body rod protein FlgB